MANSNQELLEGFFRQYENGADLYSAADNYANFVNDPSLLDASALTIDLLNVGHSTVCAFCPCSERQLLDEMQAILQRHIDRKDNGAPQHKHTYQDFKNLIQKRLAIKK